jgi:hypothetical protein
VRREPGDKALGVSEQRLPLALVADEPAEANRVGSGYRPQAVSSPAERPIAPEGTGAVPGEVFR